MGFKCISRKRGWHIAVRRDCGEFTRDPAEVYAALCAAVVADVEPFEPTQVFWEDDPDELEREKKLWKPKAKPGTSLNFGFNLGDAFLSIIALYARSPADCLGIGIAYCQFVFCTECCIQ